MKCRWTTAAALAFASIAVVGEVGSDPGVVGAGSVCPGVSTTKDERQADRWLGSGWAHQAAYYVGSGYVRAWQRLDDGGNGIYGFGIWRNRGSISETATSYPLLVEAKGCQSRS